MYIVERRDAANKSELGRNALARQRTQQSVSGTTAGSIVGLADGNLRVQGLGGRPLSFNNQVHQVSLSAGRIGYHNSRDSYGQEPERSTTVESGLRDENDQLLQQDAGNMNEGGQNTLKHDGALGFMASAAGACDSAKDLMDALRSKHANVASELEVISFLIV